MTEKTMSEFNDKRLTEAIQNLLDLFTGADGGVQYVFLLDALHRMEKQSEEGDKAATEILEIVLRFHRLVQALTGIKNQKGV